MLIRNEKKKIRRLTKKLFRLLWRWLGLFLFQLSKLLSAPFFYLKTLFSSQEFRKNEIVNYKSFYHKFKQKIRVEAKIILGKKFEEESLNIARKPIIIGLWAVMILLGSFLIWSVTIKVNSTAIAHGKIVLDSNNKKIQHLEGGIIEKIYVVDGQKVEKFQPLIKLSETSAKANQELLNKQLFALRASKIRLEAEKDYQNNLNFSAMIKEYKDDPEFLKILDGEKELFFTRRKSINEKINILQQKIKQLRNEIQGLKSQSAAVSERIDLSNDEVKSLEQLYNEGIISKSKYLELRKQMSELTGNKGEYVANISKAFQAISETELEISNTKTEGLNQVLKDLQEVKTKIADLEERISASSDILSRTIISAPQSGIVNGLKFHTTGGVIAPGGEIMEIIPQDDELIVEVKVNPQDIDVVTVGLKARVRLSAYRSKVVPLLNGEVIKVSADSFLDQPTNSYYFLSRIKIDAKELKKLDNVRLYPGMPVEAYIVTGSRTFMRYIMDPITVSMRKAFREE